MRDVDVVGFGECSVDHVSVVDELPDTNRSKVRVASSHTAFGGQVTTALAACAALGLSTRYLGPIGSDEDGNRLVDELRRRGIGIERIQRRPARTRSALILVHRATGDRYVVWQRDEGLNIAANELSASDVEGARIVHVDATDPEASQRLAELARSGGSVVTTDVDLVSPATRALLGIATVPIVAAHVPRELTGESDLRRALTLMRQPHQRFVCVTLGERGAAALEDDTFIHVPAHDVQAIDTTGAGDVFRAGFIFGLLNDWPTRRILEFANTAAAISCRAAGAMASVPSLAQVSQEIPPQC